MLFKLASIAALAATTVVGFTAPTVTTRSEFASLNPPTSFLRIRPDQDSRVSQLAAGKLTNAKRLAAGLPLNPPHRRTQPVARAVPSGTPPTFTNGYLQAFENGQEIGWISSAWNIFGENGLTMDLDARMVVQIDLIDAETGAADIKTVNGPDASLPFMGGITGFSSPTSDLNKGTADYLYFGGTVQTPPHSPPSEGANSFTTATDIPQKIQSAIYAYDSTDQSISAQWVNEDLSTSATHIGFIDDLLIMTGDMELFAAQYGPTKWVTLKFVAA